MTAKKRPPGCDSGGTADQRIGGSGSACIVAHPADIAVLHRFGRPSSYSLDPLTLAAHVRQLRRAGWQSWEIRERFDWQGAA